MDRNPREEPVPAITDSPEAVLDALTAHPEWDDRQRETQLERLIAAYTGDRIRSAIRTRLGGLGGSGGDSLLRLIELVATPELLALLARAVLAQPGLAPERAWTALTLLDDAGLLDGHPELAQVWEELNETLDEDGSLDQLAAQIEGDREGLWLALQGLAAVEPEVRAEIIAGLAQLDRPAGINLIEFLRLLSFAHEPITRSAASAALARVTGGRESPKTTSPAPRLVRSMVVALDGTGQAPVVLSATDGTTRSSAFFLCDVQHGVREVFGQTVAESPQADLFLEEIADETNRQHVRDAPGLAEGLLKGCLLLCGPETTPALRYWLEATLGPTVAPRPFPIPFPGWDPATLAADEMAERAALVLEACPSWIDTSDLTHDIAEEILLREGDSPPDERRDAGAYRYLFEHHLRGQLELYRRMLLWMASFWQAAGDTELGRSALALAEQLADEQHAVPGYPFTVALLNRSLAAAQASLRAGIDPRRRRRAPGA